MNKNSFKGFSVVYKYTLKTALKSKKYISATIIFSLVIIIGIVACLFGIDFFRNDKTDTENHIEKVYIANETELKIPLYDRLAEQAEDDYISSIEFEKVEDVSPEEFIKNTEDDYILVIQCRNENDEYYLKIISSPGHPASNDEIETFGQSMCNYYKLYICTMSGLSEDSMMQILLPVSYNINKIGDESENDVIKEVFSIVLCFVSLFVVYVLIFIYGQHICTDVTLEKSSKLVEQLLMSVSPYALVSGKILATITSSLIQFTIWVASIFIGLFVGNRISFTFSDNDVSVMSFVTDLIKDLFSGMGFSAVQVILGLLIMFIGTVFFLILAGLAGSLVTKPEESAYMQSVFIFPTLISYFAIIMELIRTEGKPSLAYHLIPFTSGMCTPASVMTGDISVGIALISLSILIISSLLLLVIAAKIYKGLLFFSGKKLKFKDIIAVIKL